MNKHPLSLMVLAPLLALVLTACPSGSTSTPVLFVTPVTLTLNAGSPAQTFTASVSGSSGAVSWSLNPASSAGSISPTSGPSTVYTPPPSVAASTTVTITAALAGSSASATAVITLTPAPATTGSLQVAISGLPSGLGAQVSVSGPGGFSRILSASQTLSSLVPGSYTLTPASITQPGTYVDSIFAANPTTATVTAGAAATTTIGYAQLPGSGKLWVPFTTSIGGYAEAQLASGTSQPPAIAFAGGDIGRLEALVFDKDGNLWASDFNYCHLFRYNASKLGQIGTVAPDVTLGNGRTCDPSKLDGPSAMAFDKNGNLWVGQYNSASLTMYTSAQLSTSGNPVPLVLTSPALKRARGLAFDAAGNLWVGNLDFHNLLMFAPDKLTAGGMQTPSRTLESPAFTMPLGGGYVAGLAFDQDGNLWVSNYTARTLLLFSPSKLAGGTQNPDKTVTPAVINPDGNGPGGLALDKQGNLWVTYTASAANLANYRLVRINAADLTDGGSPKPAAELTGYSQFGFGIPAFDPAPTSLPINP